MGKNFTGLYLFRGDNNLARINDGTPAIIPIPKAYKIGVNCDANSPAKLVLLPSYSYKNLYFFKTRLNSCLAISLGWFSANRIIFFAENSEVIKSKNSSIDI